MREVAAEFERPALLFSGGKDSICLLRLAEKAFRPSDIPMPLLNIDTGHHFPELNEFRDRRAAATRRASSSSAPSRTPSPTASPCPRPARSAATACRFPRCWRPSRSSASIAASAARGATRKRPAPRNASSASATASASGTRRTSARKSGTSTTRASIPAKTCASSRSATGPRWTCGNTSSARSSKCRRIYFSHRAQMRPAPRPMAAGQRPSCRPSPAKQVKELVVRVRTIGDIISTGMVESPADTVDDIIAEIAAARVTERGSRADDKASEAAMEDRKKAGIFLNVHAMPHTQSLRSKSSASTPAARWTTASPRSSAGCSTIPRSLMEDQIEALERSADITGGGQINLANLTDGLRAEREQGITIDVAYRYFATPRPQVHHRRHAGPRAIHAQHGHRRLHRQPLHRARGRAAGRHRAKPPAHLHRLAAAAFRTWSSP